ncbi:MAG: sigma-E processing peptidase SpoIIGA [Lachnospiraceae bacterium]|nr:sigma-E processing peptidase SpoIIGA [Lachnospiraceae bacterium]
MKYEFYADVFFLTNFYLDFLAVYTASEILRRKKRVIRYLLGAALSSLAGCILFLYMPEYAFYMYSVHFLVNPAMVIFCFFPSGKEIFVKAFFLMYFVLLLEGGSVQWLYYTVANGNNFELCLLLTGVPVGIFLYILRKKRKSVQTFYSVKIVHNGKEIWAKALCDTGNRLWDPYVGQAVHIVDKKIFVALGGKEQCPVRLIPFSSVGQKNGLIETFTAESIFVQCENEEIQISPVVLAVAEEGLFAQREYQMILHHSIFEKIEGREEKICI